MELSDLRFFRTVAEHGSISAAAKQLNYVQSSVTARIKKLESVLDTSLFHRHQKGVSLTPEGKRLLEYSQEIFIIVDKIEKTLQNSDFPSGKLEIGAVETVIQLPTILATYNKKYTDVELSLISGVTNDLIDKVLNSRLDGAFIINTATHPQLQQFKVFEEELVLLTAFDYTEEDIGKLPFLVFSPGCGYRRKLEDWLEDYDKYPAKMMEFGTLETILGSVISGLGVTIVPKSTVGNLLKKELVKVFPLPERHSRISTVFITRLDAEMTPSIEKFIEVIEQIRDNKIEPELYFSKLLPNSL